MNQQFVLVKMYHKQHSSHLERVECLYAYNAQRLMDKTEKKKINKDEFKSTENESPIFVAAEKYLPDSYVRVDAIESDLPLVLKSAFCLARESTSVASAASNDVSSSTLLVSNQFEKFQLVTLEFQRTDCIVLTIQTGTCV